MQKLYLLKFLENIYISIYIYMYIYIYEAKTVSEDLTKESKLKKEQISKKLDAQQI